MESIRANPLDGVVLLSNCDKTTAAMFMGMAADVPSVVMNGGPQLTHSGETPAPAPIAGAIKPNCEPVASQPQCGSNYNPTWSKARAFAWRGFRCSWCHLAIFVLMSGARNFAVSSPIT
jgi:hypothetical protein